MAIAPDYQGGIMPAVGAGAQGASFQPITAPSVALPNFREGLDRIAAHQQKQYEEEQDAILSGYEVELRRKATDDRVDPNSGFMALHGEAALRPDDNGASLPDRAYRSLQEFREAQMERMTPEQRVAYKKRTDGIILTQYGAASEHMFRESEAHKVTASNALITESARAAMLSPDDPTAVGDALAIAGLEGEKQGRWAGLSGAELRQSVNARRGEVINAVINAAMEKARTDDEYVFNAKALLDKYSKWMNPDDVIKTGNLINAQFDAVSTRKTGVTVAEQFKPQRGLFALSAAAQNLFNGANAKGDAKAGAKSLAPSIIKNESSGQQFVKDEQGRLVTNVGKYRDGSMPEEGKRAYGVMMVTADAASDVFRRVYGRKMTGEDANRLLSDAAFNEQVGTDYLGLMIQDFGDVAKGVAAYHAGAGNVQKAVKEGGANWLQKLGPETQTYVQRVLKDYQSRLAPNFLDGNGKAISAFSPEYASRFYGEVDEKSVREAIKAQDPRAVVDAKYLDDATAAALQELQRDKQEWMAKQTNLLNTAREKYAQTGQLPIEELNGLTPAAQQQFRDWVRAEQAGDEDRGDLKLATLAIANPGAVFTRDEKPVSSEEANALLMQMPGKLRDQARSQYFQMVNAQEAATRTAQSNNAAADAGAINLDWAQTPCDGIVSALSKRDPDAFGKLDADLQYAIAGYIRESLAETGQRNGVAVKPGDPQYEAELGKVLGTVIDLKGMLWGTNQKTFFDVDFSDLPNTGPTGAKGILTQIANAEAQRKHGRDATEAEKTALMQKILIMRSPNEGRYLQNGGPIVFDQVTWDSLTKQFCDAFSLSHGGRTPKPTEMPTNLEFLRQFVKMQLGGVRVQPNAGGAIGGIDFSDSRITGNPDGDM